jgi:type IV pilus assembly protein PilN
MIRINLLPHRELKRQARRRQFGVLCAIVAAIGAAIVIAVGGVIQGQISAQKESNEFIKKENAKLDNDIKEIAKLREEIDGLKARQKAVEDLQGDRNLPVHVLDELVKNTPEGIYLRSIKQTGGRVSLNGLALNQAKVADYVRNLGNNSAWLANPELVEIRATTANQGALARRLNEFTMNISIKRPKVADPVATVPAKPPAPGAAKS